MGREYSDEKGKYVWRTVGGRRIKIYTGQTLSQAMMDSGKFGKGKKEAGYEKETDKEKRLKNVYMMDRVLRGMNNEEALDDGWLMAGVEDEATDKGFEVFKENSRGWDYKLGKATDDYNYTNDEDYNRLVKMYKSRVKEYAPDGVMNRDYFKSDKNGNWKALAGLNDEELAFLAKDVPEFEVYGANGKKTTYGGKKDFGKLSLNERELSKLHVAGGKKYSFEDDPEFVQSVTSDLYGRPMLSVDDRDKDYAQKMYDDEQKENKRIYDMLNNSMDDKISKIREAKDKAKADYLKAGNDWHELYDKQKWNDPDSDKWHKDLDALKDKQVSSIEEYKKQLTDYMKYAKDEDLTWQDKVGMNNILMEDELSEYTRKNDPFGRNANDEKIHDGYYEIYRNNERRNAKLKLEAKPDEPYEYVDAYAGYKDKVSKHGDHDKWSGKEYTNDEFMEHLTDANWHHERRMLETAGLTNQELEYVKNNTTLSKWSAELDSKKTQKLIDEAKAKFRKSNSEAKDKYKATQHIGFGDYNKDGIPVYKNKIDNTGDFSNADVSKLSDKELIDALNVQSQEYHKASNENLGDQRTRNGRMNKIFNTAKTQQYDAGMKKINAEMEKRNMPRYNIYDDNGMIHVSSPTKEMAQRQLEEMYATDKELQKHYGWKELPKYTMRKENKTGFEETGEERRTRRNKTIQEKYAGTIEYLQENTDMDLDEILELLRKRGKR